MSTLIILVGLAPIIVSSTMALRKKSSGNESLVGLYWDSGCSRPVTSINWNKFEPGSFQDIVIYIRNEGKGNSAITLYLDTANWKPEAASDYMTLSWNYGGRSINPDEVVQATLTLSVSSNIDEITSFGFDIIVTPI